MSTPQRYDFAPVSDPEALAAWARERAAPEDLDAIFGTAWPVPIQRLVLEHAPVAVLGTERLLRLAGSATYGELATRRAAECPETTARLLEVAFDRLLTNETWEWGRDVILRLYGTGAAPRPALLAQARRLLAAGQRPAWYGIHALADLPCWFDYSDADLALLIEWGMGVSVEAHFLCHPNTPDEEAYRWLTATIPLDEDVRRFFALRRPDAAFLARLMADLPGLMPGAQVRLLGALTPAWRALLDPGALLPLLESDVQAVRIAAQLALGRTTAEPDLRAARSR
jgi:hypothetical protein